MFRSEVNKCFNFLLVPGYKKIFLTHNAPAKGAKRLPYTQCLRYLFEYKQLLKNAGQEFRKKVYGIRPLILYR